MKVNFASLLRERDNVKIGSTHVHDNNVILDTVITSSEVNVPLSITGLFGFNSKRALFFITYISLTRNIIHNGQHPSMYEAHIKKERKVWLRWAAEICVLV